ncbi:site-specific DNA methylase [Flavobacterium phage FPSV-S1]|nr:site-specific DNA methylase [Flavobacterium phage FPSV-S1]QCW20640.1 site-specific DNA methylase [Flavobacterium phage FPSV-S27]
MNVLSLFDGISCGQIALQRAGVKVDGYFASEIDKYAIQIAKENHPNTKHLGSVIDLKGIELPKIDLLIGGSPCQSFSNAGDGSGFNGKSGLFYEYVRILKETNPTYFLLENVKMKKEWQDVISKELGVEPIEINSALVSAQSRKRLYWTNIPNVTTPLDKKILLKNILEEGVLPLKEKSQCVLSTIYKENVKSMQKRNKTGLYVECILAGMATDINGHDILKRVYDTNGKSPTVTAAGGGNTEPKILLDEKTYRKLTPKECERLQTLPDDYTASLSKTQRYKTIGNGWTVDVIAHIFKDLIDEF